MKVAIFLGYLILCSKQKDVHRVFCYHGAEHKTIFCYEAGLPLTVENVRHPAQAPSPLRHQLSVRGDHSVHSGVQPGVPLHQLAEHLGPHRRCTLLLLIPVVGITYEFNRFVGAGMTTP